MGESTAMQWSTTAIDTATVSIPGTSAKSWSELHEHVRDARKLQAKLTNMVRTTVIYVYRLG